MPVADWLIDPLVLARFVHFAACSLAAGTAAFAVLAVDGTDAAFARLKRRWRAIVSLAAAVAAISGAWWLLLVAAGILDQPVAASVFDSGLWSVATGTQFGHFALARLVLALLLIAPVWPSRLRLAVSLALIVLIAPAGHAGAQPGLWGDLHLAADAIHLAAAGAWLGGVPALALLLGAARRDPKTLAAAAARTTARFSLLGIACVTLLTASGVANSWFLLSGPGDLVTTLYGQVLALKVALFAAMLAIATANRFYLTPRLADPGAMHALQQTCIVELGLGLAVIFLAAVLGTLAPPVHHHGNTSIPSDAAFVHIHADAVMADVTVAPGRVGRADVRIHLSSENLADFSARAVHLALRPPEADRPAVASDATLAAGAVWTVSGIALPQPGIWTVVLRVAPQQGAIVELDGPIVIAH